MLKKIKSPANDDAISVLVEAERAKTNALFTSIGEGAIVTDEFGKIKRINSLALEMLGFTEKEVLGQWFPRVIIAQDANGVETSNIDRPISKALLQGKPINAKLYYRKKDGSNLPVFITVAPVLLDNLPIGAIEVFRDITRENEVEMAKDEFLSLASHQLRTPATAVKQFLGLILEGYTKSKQEADTFLKDAYDSNDEQLLIIDDILNVAKIEAGKLELNADQVDLTQLVDHAVAELKASAKTKKHILTLEVPDHSITLSADKLKIMMSVQNLITNAIKYTPDGGKIAVTLTETSKHVTITVRDNGIGISRADQGKLFSKFGRIQTDFTIHVPGTGLGLYLVKQYIDMHGGAIRIQSKVGHGTAFIIELPKET